MPGFDGNLSRLSWKLLSPGGSRRGRRVKRPSCLEDDLLSRPEDLFVLKDDRCGLEDCVFRRERTVAFEQTTMSSRQGPFRRCRRTSCLCRRPRSRSGRPRFSNPVPSSLVSRTFRFGGVPFSLGDCPFLETENLFVEKSPAASRTTTFSSRRSLIASRTCDFFDGRVPRSSRTRPMTTCTRVVVATDDVCPRAKAVVAD